jgi:hypothetical protein
MITVLVLFVSNIFMTLTPLSRQNAHFIREACSTQRSSGLHDKTPGAAADAARVGRYGVMRGVIPATSLGRG